MVIKALVQGISIKQPNVEPLYQSIIVVLAAKSEQIFGGYRNNVVYCGCQR